MSAFDTFMKGKTEPLAKTAEQIELEKTAEQIEFEKMASQSAAIDHSAALAVYGEEFHKLAAACGNDEFLTEIGNGLMTASQNITIGLVKCASNNPGGAIYDSIITHDGLCNIAEAIEKTAAEAESVELSEVAGNVQSIADQMGAELAELAETEPEVAQALVEYYAEEEKGGE